MKYGKQVGRMRDRQGGNKGGNKGGRFKECQSEESQTTSINQYLHQF